MGRPPKSKFQSLPMSHQGNSNKANVKSESHGQGQIHGQTTQSQGGMLMMANTNMHIKAQQTQNNDNDTMSHDSDADRDRAALLNMNRMAPPPLPLPVSTQTPTVMTNNNVFKMEETKQNYNPDNRHHNHNMEEDDESEDEDEDSDDDIPEPQRPMLSATGAAGAGAAGTPATATAVPHAAAAAAAHTPSLADVAGGAAPLAAKRGRGRPKGSKGKKPKGERCKKDPRAPKRSKSAYIFYAMEKRDVVKAKLGPCARVGDMAKLSSGMWKELKPDEKKKWEDIAEADRLRYHKEKAAYTGPLLLPKPTPPSASDKAAFMAALAVAAGNSPAKKQKVPKHQLAGASASPSGKAAAGKAAE
jgi:hypothetical protein